MRIPVLVSASLRSAFLAASVHGPGILRLACRASRKAITAGGKRRTLKYSYTKNTITAAKSKVAIAASSIARKIAKGLAGSEGVGHTLRLREQEDFVVIIPSYNDMRLLKRSVPLLMYSCELANRISAGRVRISKIVLCDDKSTNPKHLEELNSLVRSIRSKASIELAIVAGEENKGFSANVNRGLQKGYNCNYIVVNSDVYAFPFDIAKVIASYNPKRDGVIGAMLRYSNMLVQHCGGIRNPRDINWFDHLDRMKFKWPAKPLDWSAAYDNLYSTGALLLINKSLVSKNKWIFSPDYKMGFEDVDLCLRAWDMGLNVKTNLTTWAIHDESQTRGNMDMTASERFSQQKFWENWSWFFSRDVRDTMKKIRIIVVTQDFGIGGGHRVIFNWLKSMNQDLYSLEIASLAKAEPDWYALPSHINIRLFEDYDDMHMYLSCQDAFKVATWWETANVVWRSSVAKGVPCYFVQDIESSYYRSRHQPKTARLVEEWYRREFIYLTTNDWITDWLKEKIGPTFIKQIGLGLDDIFAHPGQDHVLRPGERKLSIHCIARGEPLKNFGYCKSVASKLKQMLNEEFELLAWGSEGGLLVDGLFDQVIMRPTDEQILEIYREKRFFIQTSIHEGFSLPPLEAMSQGCIPIVTRAVGNTYIKDGINGFIISSEDVTKAAGQLVDIFNKGPKYLYEIQINCLQTAKNYTFSRMASTSHILFDQILDDYSYGI